MIRDLTLFAVVARAVYLWDLWAEKYSTSYPSCIALNSVFVRGAARSSAVRASPTGT